MNAKLLAAGLACIIITACSKDKYSTKPALEFKSLNGNSFTINSDINFKFIVTDKEGDIQDSMWIQKVSLVCDDSSSKVPTPYLLPAVTATKDLKAEVDVNYTYGTNSGAYPGIYRCADQRDDSLYFRFWLKDKAGHVSDTVTSSTIKLLKE